MTEGTGARYWASRIGQAKERYNEWCKRREPRGADWQEWQDWHAWKQARIEYFNTERSKIYGNSPKRRNISTGRVAYLNGCARDARDRRGNARG